jgi:hypothetical protein
VKVKGKEGVFLVRRGLYDGEKEILAIVGTVVLLGVIGTVLGS